MAIMLETKRLIIQTPSEEDIEHQYQLQSDSDVMQYVGTGIRTRQEVKKGLHLAIQHYHKHRFSLGSVFLKETNEFVGRAGLIYLAFDDAQPDIEIAYALLKSHWNKGYATELAHALISWGFSHLNLHKIVAVTRPENEKSRDVLKKCGMHFVKMTQYNGINVTYYEIDRTVNPHHCLFSHLSQNMRNVYGERGNHWIRHLPIIVDELRHVWKLKNIQPVSNMSFHFVAKTENETNQPLVLKIGLDQQVIENELHALEFFNGYAAVKVINHHKKHNALLLEQAVPGESLKTIYPTQCHYVFDEYAKTVKRLHTKKIQEPHNFIHVREWLTTLDKVTSNDLPKHLLDKAKELKNDLLATSQHEILLHGDLHHDNILKQGTQWIIIDPKGIIGELEFEIAAFDFIHPSELSNPNLQDVFKDRIKLLSNKMNLDFNRVQHWVFVRLILSAAWSIEDKDDPSKAINLAKILYV